MEESDRIQGIYRMLDANRNRVAEGLRVIEDFTRFCREDRGLTERIRQIRHEVRKNLQSLERDMMLPVAPPGTRPEGLRRCDLDRKPVMTIGRGQFPPGGRRDPVIESPCPVWNGRVGQGI